MYNQSLSVYRYTICNQTLIVDFDFHTVEIIGMGEKKIVYPEIAKMIKKYLYQKFTPKGFILQHYLTCIPELKK